MTSLIAVANSTKAKGTAVVNREVGDTPSICYWRRQTKEEWQCCFCLEGISLSSFGGNASRQNTKRSVYLDTGCEQEKNVGVFGELLIQKLGQEGEVVVLGGRDTVVQIFCLDVAFRIVEVDDADPFLVGRGSASEVGKEVGKRRAWFVGSGGSPWSSCKRCGGGRCIRPCELVG